MADFVKRRKFAFKCEKLSIQKFKQFRAPIQLNSVNLRNKFLLKSDTLRAKFHFSKVDSSSSRFIWFKEREKVASNKCSQLQKWIKATNKVDGQLKCEKIQLFRSITQSIEVIFTGFLSRSLFLSPSKKKQTTICDELSTLSETGDLPVPECLSLES